jgi:hypothetical protein
MIFIMSIRKCKVLMLEKSMNICETTKIVTLRRFVYAKEGIQGIDMRDSKTRKARVETRRECNTHLVIICNGKYMVANFVAKHNHNLHLSMIVHMMLAQKKNFYN